MNIVFISTTYPIPLAPGQGTFNASLVESLRIRHRVKVIAPIPWTRWIWKRNTTKGPAIQCADTQHPVYWYPPRLFHYARHHSYWRSIVRSVKALESFDADVVVGYWLHPDGLAAVRAAQELNVPCVLMSGGSDLKLLPKNPRRRQSLQQAIDKCSRLVVISEDLREDAISLGIDPQKVGVCPRGIDDAIFRPRERRGCRATLGLAEDAIVLVWAGRLEPIKNPQLFLRAVIKWRERWGSRLQVLVAGDGSLRGALQRMVQSNGLASNVTFVGTLDQEQLAFCFGAADCTVLTSESEGIPNVLLESIACGTRFVASDVGGIREIATPGLDDLIPSGDLQSLVDAVVQRVESPSGIAPIGHPRGRVQAAQEFAKQLSIVTHGTSDREVSRSISVLASKGCEAVA